MRTDDVERLETEICVVAAQRGDPDAFRRLVELYETRLLYFIRRFARDSDSPLDLLQEVWITVLRHRFAAIAGGIQNLAVPDRTRPGD